ncbi:MAG: FIST C-terminal domain-containing protein [Gammaproteobacteria bacterium]|nr:FIST C-terminal domain-containing protein [Gammaproteobacteria bacterium]
MAAPSSSPILLGHAAGPDTHEVALACLETAYDGVPSDFMPGWALAFCGGRHDGELFLAGLRTRLGDIPVIGGAAVGTITAETCAYSGFEALVAVFPADLSLSSLHFDELGQDEFSVGQSLGRRLSEEADGCSVLVFYDSVRHANPVQLHVGSRLLDGMYDVLGDKPLQVLGGGTLADFNFGAGYIFDGIGSMPHGVVAAVLPPEIKLITRIFHGCMPASSFMTITRIEGAVVYELDGKPALEALTAILGADFFSGPAGQLTLTATLGEKQGDLFAPYEESAYVNRLILSHDPAQGSITLFEPDFAVGSRIQVMSRSNALMLDSVRQGAVELAASLEGEQPLLAFYVDCAGRSSMVSGAEVEEAGIVAAELARCAPVCGFYSGVEFAPVHGRSRPLDWTGVAMVFCLNQDGQ